MRHVKVTVTDNHIWIDGTKVARILPFYQNATDQRKIQRALRDDIPL